MFTAPASTAVGGSTNELHLSVVVRFTVNEFTPLGPAPYTVISPGKWFYVFAEPSENSSGSVEVHEIQALEGGTFSFTELHVSRASGTVRREPVKPYGTGGGRFAYSWRLDDQQFCYAFLSATQLTDKRLADYARITDGVLVLRSAVLTLADLRLPPGVPAVTAPGSSAPSTDHQDFTEGPRRNSAWTEADVVFRDHWQLALDLHGLYIQALAEEDAFNEGEQALKGLHASLALAAARVYQRGKNDADASTPALAAAADVALDANRDAWPDAWRLLRRDTGSGGEGLLTYTRSIEHARETAKQRAAVLYGVCMSAPAFRQAVVDRFAFVLPERARLALSRPFELAAAGCAALKNDVDAWLGTARATVPTGDWGTLATDLEAFLTPCQAADRSEAGRAYMRGALTETLSAYHWVTSSALLVRRVLMTGAAATTIELDDIVVKEMRDTERARREAALARIESAGSVQAETGRMARTEAEAAAARARVGRADVDVGRGSAGVAEADRATGALRTQRRAAVQQSAQTRDTLAAAFSDLAFQNQVVASLDLAEGEARGAIRGTEIALESRNTLLAGLLDTLGVRRPAVSRLVSAWRRAPLVRYLVSEGDGLADALLSTLLRAATDAEESAALRGALQDQHARLSRVVGLQQDALRLRDARRVEVANLEVRQRGEVARVRELTEEVREAEQRGQAAQRRLDRARAALREAVERRDALERTRADVLRALNEAETRLADASRRVGELEDARSVLRSRARLADGLAAGWTRAAVALHGIGLLISFDAILRAGTARDAALEGLGAVGSALDLLSGLRLTGLHGSPRLYANLFYVGAAALVLEVAYAAFQASRAYDRGDDNAAFGFALIAVGAGAGLAVYLGAAPFLGPLGLAVAVVGIGFVMFGTDTPLETWLKTSAWSMDARAGNPQCARGDLACEVNELVKLFLQPQVRVRFLEENRAVFDPRVGPPAGITGWRRTDTEERPVWVEFELSIPSAFDPTRMRYVVEPFEAAPPAPGRHYVNGVTLTGRTGFFNRETRSTPLPALSVRDTQPNPFVYRHAYESAGLGDVDLSTVQASCRVRLVLDGPTADVPLGTSFDFRGKVGQWVMEGIPGPGGGSASYGPAPRSGVLERVAGWF